MNDSRQSLEETKGGEEVKERLPHNQSVNNDEDDLIYKYDENADQADGAREKAEEKMYDLYMRNDQKISLVDMQIQDLRFMAQATNEGGASSEIIQSKQLTSLMLSSMWDSVVEIDVSRNMISQIDALNQFRNLKILRASENYILDVSLTQPRLEEVYLENNQISRFPLLTQQRSIKIVNLSQNRLEEFKAEFKPPSCESLLQLDISFNAINFASEQDFFEQFLERIKKAKNLQRLWIQGNPFAVKGQEKRFEKIVAQLLNLQYLNGEPASNFKRALKLAEEGGAGTSTSMMQKSQKQGPMVQPSQANSKRAKLDKNAVYIPTLEILCYSLEAANSHPSYALEHLRDLAHDVEKISDHLDLVDEHFAKGKNEDEINDMIEDFMQNAQLLINNHHELQNIILTILSKLSIIKFFRFGVSCFNTLKDLMIAGKEMEEMVTQIIKQEVIHMLHQQINPEMVPDSLLSGLLDLVKETQQSDMLTGLYENCFPQWLRQLLVRINSCKRIAVMYDDNPHFDSALGLLSVSLLGGEDGGSSAGKKNAEKALEKGLIPLIADIIVESNWEKERYLHCLKIIELLCLNVPEAANLFIEKNVHTYLLKNIRVSMIIYKKNNDLIEGDSKDQEKNLPKKYITLAAEIDSLGSLLQSDNLQYRQKIQQEPLIDDMLSILKHYKTDPVLLTALCKFAKAFFSCEEIKNNSALMFAKVDKISSLTQLVPYLGLKKYEDLLKMARRYNPQMDSESDKYIQFQHLDDPIVHDLFIAIVQLMTFFCEEAVNNSDNDGSVFELVSRALNENSRETALFNCIEVPNDDLKLAVVECLYNVSLSEFDSEELTQIVKVLSSCKNIGAGKTELVLAKLFWILTKLTKEEEEESGKNFRLKFGEKAIKEACDILERNLNRQIEKGEEDEEHEKLSLSLSCLHFLKFSSENPDTKKYLLNRHDQLKQILFADQSCTSESFTKYAVDVEETWLGRNMDTLLYVLNGEDSISPYNYVSFRIIQRMADVLMNYGIDDPVFDPFLPNVDVLLIMKEHYKDKFKLRKQRERAYWKEPDKDLIDRIKQLQNKNQLNVVTGDSAFYHAFFRQHYWFTSNNGIPILRMFLTKKVALCEQWLKQEYDKWYDKHSLLLKQAMTKQVKKAEAKELWHREQEEIKKKNPIEVPLPKKEGADREDEGIGLKVLKRALMLEEVGQHYDPERSVDHLTLQSKHYKPQVLEQNMEKRNIFAENKSKNNASMIQSLKLRSLSIAAYLRCLYGAIEYAPKETLRAEAIQCISELYVFRNITILCDTTDWLEANIGAKYLRIARHVIKCSFRQVKENKEERIQHYEIVARAIRKMLNQIRIKLQNEQQKPLTNEDKVLIYEISQMCQIMCSQVATMFEWSAMEVKEQGAHVRTRRTPQEKTVDRMIAQMFPSQNIMTLIAIVFRDMDINYKQLDPSQASLLQVEPPDIQEKNHQARENIKLFLGDYLSRCKDSKYDILESLMKGVVFEKKRLRESFQQEILDAQIFSSYKMAIQGYLHNPTLNRQGLSPNERVVQMAWVLCSQQIPGKKYQDYQPRLLIFTDIGIHIMLPPSGKPCTYCPPENLCPSGPVVEHKIPYTGRLVKFMFFGEDLPQKIQLLFTPEKQVKQPPIPYNNLEQYHIVSILIPQETTAREIGRLIKDELAVAFTKGDSQEDKQIEQLHDRLFRASLSRLVSLNEPQEETESQFAFAKYASVNPPAKGGGILSMLIGGGGSTRHSVMQYDVLQNCTLVVLTKTEIIFLKESWSKWVYEPSQEKASLILELLSSKEDTRELKPIPSEILIENKLKNAMQTMLIEEGRRNLDEIVNLHIHKGREPLVEIEYGGKKKDVIVFMCDYSRQMFVKALVDVKNGGD